MKKILFVTALAACSAWAQTAGNIVSTITVNSDTALPNGASVGSTCTNYNVIYVSNTTGHVIKCVNTNPLAATGIGNWTVVTSGAGGGSGAWGAISGTIGNQTDLGALLAAKQNLLTPLTCPAGQHMNVLASNGTFGCTPDSGGSVIPATSSLLKGNNGGGAQAASVADVTNLFSGVGSYLRSDGTRGTPAGGSGATIPTTTAVLKGDNTGNAAAASSTDVIGLFTGTTGALCADGTRGTCGISGGGSANISNGASSASRPTYSTAGFFVDNSKNPAQRATYFDPIASAWFTPGLFSGNFTQDSGTGQTDLNLSNVPLLTTANTFGTGLQTIPHLKVGVDCLQPDGTTPCFGSGSNVVAVQQNSTSQGNASTLNFGAGLTATTSAGTTTLVNSGIRSLNGRTTPDQSFLPELATDADGWLTITSHSTTGTGFHLYNTQSTSGGIHNWAFFLDTGGNLGVYDDSGGGFMGGWHQADHAVLSGGGYQTSVRAFSGLPTCDSAHDGQFASVNDSTVNTWGTTVTGGGTNHVGVYCDSVSWTVMSK